jgi:glycogen synthase
VEYLTRELAALDQEVKVLCFGDQREAFVTGIQAPMKIPVQDPRHEKLMDTLARNLVMAGTLKDVDVVHCHTWYTHYAGCLVKRLLEIPLVLTTHSLEPHRPWKVEQLGTAYNVSTWLEKTTYQNADGVIAVSQSMRTDVHELYGVPFEKIRVIHNGIDLNQYKPTPNPKVLAAYGIDAVVPFVLFVGRITRQKGFIHLVNALKYLRAGVRVVLAAGAPDTKEIGQEMAEAVKQAKAETKNEIVWIEKILPKHDLISLYSHAALFVCPSVYEPFGIINLEAMACGIPVVASAVGGIPEVVVPGETGVLVPVSGDFPRDLAAAINRLLDSPESLKIMGRNARRRVEQHFSWSSIARQTLDFYKELSS